MSDRVIPSEHKAGLWIPSESVLLKHEFRLHLGPFNSLNLGRAMRLVGVYLKEPVRFCTRCLSCSCLKYSEDMAAELDHVNGY